MKTIKNFMKSALKTTKRAFAKYCEMNYEANKPMWENGINWM